MGRFVACRLLARLLRRCVLDVGRRRSHGSISLE